MLETIGFIVWILITLGLTAMPFLIGCFANPLAGGLLNADRVVCLVFACLAAVSWYFVFASTGISIDWRQTT
jgi:hypothetical protein